MEANIEMLLLETTKLFCYMDLYTQWMYLLTGSNMYFILLRNILLKSFSVEDFQQD